MVAVQMLAIPSSQRAAAVASCMVRLAQIASKVAVATTGSMGVKAMTFSSTVRAVIAFTAELGQTSSVLLRVMGIESGLRISRLVKIGLI